MNVLIINNGPKPLPAIYGGGVETLTQFIIDKEFGNHQITIASIYCKAAVEESNKYPHIKFVYLDFNSIIYKLQLLLFYLFNHFVGIDIGNALCNLVMKAVDINQYDVIISENGVRLGKNFRNKFKGKLVLHLHNDWLNVKTKYAELYKCSYDEIWTISKYLKHRVDEIKGSTPVKVLYNGVDTTLFNPSVRDNRNKIRAKYGISEDDIVIANCCRIVEEKGVLQTIEVFESLKTKYAYNNIKLMIIGDVSIDNDYIKSVKVAASNDVIFTGFVNHDNLPHIMGCADIGIASTIHLDSKYTSDEYNGVIECFNLTVIEFMALGIPVIATNSGGMPEILCSEYSDYIIDARESTFSDSLEITLNKMIVKLQTINYEEKSLRTVNIYSKESYINSFYNLLLNNEF